MKVIKLFLIGLISLIIFTGCEKSELTPTEELNLPSANEQYGVNPADTGGVIVWGEFVVIDAVMYVNNHETGEKKSFNHFDSNKTTSSLRWGGSSFDIETIEKNVTNYKFYPPISIPGTGKFILNNDTTKYYGVHYTNNFSAIVEDPTHNQQNIGGSSRPFSGITLSNEDQTVNIRIMEVEGSIDGYNVNYYTIMTIKRIGDI